MNILIVFAHPSPNSLGARILKTATMCLEGQGHQLCILDLNREGFNPVMACEEWEAYFTDPGRNAVALADHIEALRWAEALCLIFPTWYYGPPAILKGWLERVFLPGVAFEVPDGKSSLIKGRLHNIRNFVVITTSGSPWWWLRLIRDPGRSMLMRGIRALFHPKCRRTWIQLHDMDRADDARRERFLQTVRDRLARL